MTDYWKSHERHYCKYCNVWMQGDKNGVRHHEQGRKHKEMVENTLKEKRKEKSQAAYAERDLKQQLREIEEAAQARYAQDLAAAGLPPPPPPRPGHRGGRGGGRGGPGREYGGQRRPGPRQDEAPTDAAEEEVAPKEDDKGIYAIRGTVYLEGKRHEEQLVIGSACQVWVDDVEEWLDALIETAVVHQVPNTDLSFRRFSITYMLPEAPAPVTEEDVRSDRLRIKLPDGVTKEDAERMLLKYENGEVETIEQAHIVVDETTGMGEWSTVAVEEIDESEDAVAHREAEAEAEEARRMEEEKRRDALEDFSGQGDNALGAFNPWGGSYKGIELDNESASVRKAREEEIMIQADGDVEFKKRRNATDSKLDAKKKKKQRRIRSGDDDE